MQSELDAYDRRILALLQDDASLSSAQIAEKVGLSQSPCWRRIQRLKDEGVIRGQVTLLDRKKIGLNTQIFAEVKLNAHGQLAYPALTHLADGRWCPSARSSPTCEPGASNRGSGPRRRPAGRGRRGSRR